MAVAINNPDFFNFDWLIVECYTPIRTRVHFYQNLRLFYMKIFFNPLANQAIRVLFSPMMLQ